MTERWEEIREQFFEKAAEMEDNPVHPGEPTLTSIVALLATDLAILASRVEKLEATETDGSGSAD